MSKKAILIIGGLLLLFQFNLRAQMKGGFSRPMMGGAGTKGSDSLQKRDQLADSITLFYKLYASNEIKKLDTSILDFYTKFPLPYTVYNLGNTGTASKSYLFSTMHSSGLDIGYHAFDAYDYNLETTPLYQTTRPYTELTYLLGGKGEQLIAINHTQNKKQQLNYSFDYRFSNAPGNLKNQQANFNNMRFVANFQSKKKRYLSNFVWINNKTASSENGGLVNASLLDSLALNNPYELETRLGQSAASFRNPFNTSIATGNIYQNNTIVWRQSYDIGQKDSIVKDTITTYLFFPRLRFQNEIAYQTNDYLFRDASADALKYLNYFNFTSQLDTIRFQDKWKNFSNEFSLISYPQKNNSNQYLQIGGGFLHLAANFLHRMPWNSNETFGFTRYKNKTRNQIWDLDLSAKLFLTGYHAGDYQTKAYLSSQLDKKGNYIQLGFENTNRTPSANYMGITDFPIIGLSNIKKENTLQFFASTGNEKKAWKAIISYQFIQNYAYFETGFQPAIYNGTINYLKAQFQNKIIISKHWNWYNELYLQKTDANTILHLPLLLTRQRIAFEGQFYKNLQLSTGLEFIYHTSYKADAYMPFTGQFYTQSNELLQNRPIANAYFHMMIKRLKAYIRLENLNTLLPSSTSSGNHFNFTAPNYASTGVWVRVGIWWNFIN